MLLADQASHTLEGQVRELKAGRRGVGGVDQVREMHLEFVSDLILILLFGQVAQRLHTGFLDQLMFALTVVDQFLHIQLFAPLEEHSRHERDHRFPELRLVVPVREHDPLYSIRLQEVIRSLAYTHSHTLILLTVHGLSHGVDQLQLAFLGQVGQVRVLEELHEREELGAVVHDLEHRVVQHQFQVVDRVTHVVLRCGIYVDQFQVLLQHVVRFVVHWGQSVLK